MMTNVYKTTNYQGLALLLGAVSIVAVACGDDDSTADPGGEAGEAGGGTSAGKSNGGAAGKAGNPSGGSNGGTPTGGTGGTGGTPTAGTGGMPSAGTGGNGAAGEGMGGAGGAGSAGESWGGDGQGGDGPGPDQGGAGGEVGGEGGAGGAGEVVIVPDELDNGTFTAWYADWSELGNTDAATANWIYGEEPGLNHWAATAYIVSTFQTVGPLPDGNYAFSMEVQRAANLNSQYLFAKGCTEGEPTTEVTESTAAAGSSGFTKITLNVVVTSGSCTVGIYTDAPAGGWANMDNALFVKQ
jgi:hypothetical protein